MTRDLRPTSVVAAERIKQGAKPMRAPYISCFACRWVTEETSKHYLGPYKGDDETHVLEDCDNPEDSVSDLLGGTYPGRDYRTLTDAEYAAGEPAWKGIIE